MPKSNGHRGKKLKKIYMDYASSALASSANPGAIHILGVQEKSKLETARVKVARILSATPDEVVFTSGATESNNLAILGVASQLQKNSAALPASGLRHGRNFSATAPHIVTTNIEHASVLETCKHLGNVTFVPVESNGIVDPEKIKKALKPNTVLVSVMYANNEIGTIQPIQEIAKVIRHFNKTNNKKVYFHTDATQAINYLPINVQKLGVDLMSFNSAKIYGPKGVGALYVRRNTPIQKIMWGGEQEYGLRPGTENVEGILKFVHAFEGVEKIKDNEVKRLTKLRDYFIAQLQHSNILKNVRMLINGDLVNRLPNNVNITIPNIPSDLLVIELSARGIMASAKSACKAGDGKASHVIEAIRRDTDLSRRSHAEVDGSLRFSLGRETMKKDIDYTLKALQEILKKLGKWYNI
jgi:cysteine desulfurase